LSCLVLSCLVLSCLVLYLVLFCSFFLFTSIFHYIYLSLFRNEKQNSNIRKKIFPSKNPYKKTLHSNKFQKFHFNLSKNLKAFSVEIFSTSASIMPRTSAIFFATETTKAGSHLCPRTS